MSTNHARARGPGGSEGHIEEGVRRCVELMTADEWVTGESHAKVAAEFGVSPHTVKTWASAAARIIRIAIGEGDEVRARLFVTLERLQRMAESKQAATADGEIYAAPDVKAAIQAVAERAKLWGLVEQRHKVDITVQAIDALPFEQKLGRIDAQIEALQRAKAMLLQQNSVPALPGSSMDENTSESNVARMGGNNVSRGE